MGAGRSGESRQRRADSRWADDDRVDQRPGGAGARHAAPFGRGLPGRAARSDGVQPLALRSHRGHADEQRAADTGGGRATAAVPAAAVRAACRRRRRRR